MERPHQQEAGVDLVQIERMKPHIKDPVFLNRVFNPEEIDFIQSHKKPEVHLAGRWAAKEAVSKALGCGIGGKLAFKDITILRQPDGKPKVQLNGEANKRFNHPLISLSISHDGDYAIAFVVVQFSE